METLTATKTVFTASQFLDWQRNGTLVLQPNFQRREVWKKPAKSYFIDTLIRGYPVPVILLRQVQDLKTLRIGMEVIDGQQRLHTLLSFLDPTSIPDFDQAKDGVQVTPTHNSDKAIANKPFSKLTNKTQRHLLAYEFSTHVFPATTGDEQVYRIFSRLNSTGLNLNPQEIRNATYHGEFKTLAYNIGMSRLEYWIRNKIFSHADIARMAEAEAVSEMIMAMHNGVTAKSQPKINDFYKAHESEYTSAKVATKRFSTVMDSIENKLGDTIKESNYRRSAIFFSLFVAVYAHMYGLKSKLSPKKPIPLPNNFKKNVIKSSDEISNKTLDKEILDAMGRATGNKATRDIRHKYLMKNLGLKNAK